MAEPFAIGSHIFLDPYESGVSDTSNKAAAGSFAEIGIVSDSEWTPTYMTSDVVGPKPGGRRRLHVVPVGQTIEYSFTVQTLNTIFWQVLMGSTALTAGATETFNPFSSGAPWEGWVKCQFYNGAHTLKGVLDVYSSLTVDAVPFGAEGHVTATFQGKVIDSAENVCILYALEA